MVCTVEQEFCSAGNRAKLTDYQFVLVDRVLIQNIIFLKILRVPDKIIIYCVIADYDTGIVNDIFQVNSFFVFLAGINFLWHGCSFHVMQMEKQISDIYQFTGIRADSLYTV